MNVLVIAADGLQAGYVGCYGNEWVETPALDRLAAEGVVFDRHHADRPDAAGARHAWRTGRYDFPATPAEPELGLPAADLLTRLTGAGVTTTLVMDASRPSPAEFTAGWGQVIQVRPPVAAEATALEQTLDAAAEALERLASREHWLLWLDLAALRPPWEVSPKYRDCYFQEEEEDEDEALTPLTDPIPGRLAPDDWTSFARLQRTYAGAVTFLDAGLGLLLEELRERGLMDELAVVVTAGWGLPLGEHGGVGEGWAWLHEERVHVPLILRLPGAAEAGRRVFALTQPVDVPATLLDLFGLPPADLHGHSLLPLCRGRAEAVRAYACSGLRSGAGIDWALRTPEWAFLLPAAGETADSRGPQLYVKPDDRWEVNDIHQHHLELTQHLEATLHGFVEATRRPGPLQTPELPDLEAAETWPTPGGNPP
jgi:arylsulfatase A-like enzyme